MQPSRLLLLLLAGLAAFSCSTNDATRLRLISPLPAGVIPRDTVLAFSFSRGVVPSESLNTWTATPLIEFSPAIAGKFTWDDTTRLRFSPDGPLPGDVRFTGKLNTALLARMAGAEGFSGPERFEFSTRRFTLQGAEFFYDRLAETRQVGIKANLLFSYAVNPQDLSTRLRVTLDGAPQQGVRVMTSEPNSTIAVELGPATELEKERRIEVMVAADLVSPETGTNVTMEAPLIFVLPALEHLKIYSHEAGFDGAQGWVRVTTSQEVDAAAARAAIRLEPNKEFTVTGGGNSFVLHGAFTPGTTMKMTIAAGLESVLGGRTENAYEADVYIGSIPPSFRFLSENGVYMLLGGEKKLEVRTINVPKLNVRISQVFQNNLVYFLQNGRYYDYDYWGGGEEEQTTPTRKYRYELGNYGRQLSADSLVIGGPENQEASTMLDLNPYLHTGYRGFYLVEIARTAEPWRTTSKLVSISDLGLIVKQSPDGAVVFVTSLESTAPVGGATVSLVSTNNQVIASGKTDGEGVVRFSGLEARLKDFPAMLVTAELESDFNFLTLEDYRVETSRYDVGGKRQSQGAYDAMLYGDRTLYRPGETVIVSGLVRQLAEELPASMPVKLKVVNPRGSTVAEQQLVLNADGSFETTFPTRPASLTGEYRFDLFTGAGLYLAGYRVSVEEFVPDRLRVQLTPSQERARAGDKLRYELNAHNFFGPPAAGRNWQFEGSFSTAPYVSTAYPEFRFADDGARTVPVEPVLLEGKTDQKGSASFDLQVPSGLATTGMVRVLGKAAVFDESGRPVYQRALTLVDPKDYYIGVRRRGSYYVSPSTPQKMQVVAVDPLDKPLRGFRARIEVIRLEWHSVLRQHGYDKTLRYVSERREIPVSSEVITLGGDGPTEHTYTAPRSGEYVVRVSRQGEQGYNQFSFYAYSWGTTDVTSFAVDPEARIEIVLDKPRYAPGEKARVLFQAPFSGKMLVSVERNGLLMHRFLEVANNAASMELQVEERYLPNVYISAVLFRTVKDQSIPLLAGHGFAPLFVERASDRLAVTIKAPRNIRPRSVQTVTISVPGERNAAVTLAAVDEGILQLKNYKTPDPYGYFYARKALETETYDFFKHLLPEPAARRVSSAGGSDAELGARVNPLSVQRVKPVAFWSGIRHLNGSGEAEVKLEVPDFNGEIRLMAFVYKGDRFGSAEQAMTAADPFVVSPALPRFLSPGDSIAMAITVHNTTAAPGTLRFEVAAGGSIRVTSKPGPLSVPAGQEAFVLAGLRAGQQMGKATVTVRTATPDGTLESSTDLPVRPATPYVVDAVTGIVEAGKPVTHTIPDVYMGDSRKMYVTISPFPVAGFAGRLKELLGYPHGCLEQVVSKAFPQLYLRDIAAALAPGSPVLAQGSPGYNVSEAIGIVASLQTPDGAFLYWPGSTINNAWTTVYASHFLLEARKAGYAVPEGAFKQALGALAGIARGRKTMDYSFWQEGKVVVRRIANKATVYALYVLAAAGVPDRSVMDFYRGDRSLLTADTRAMLAAAYALAGDRRAFTELLPAAFAVEEPVRTTGDDFDSPVRANALILNMLLETDLNSLHIPRYMDYLSRRYAQDRWFSTQDDAFTLLAFGKAARMAAASKLSGGVRAGGKDHAYNGGTQRFDLNAFGQPVTLSLKGEGRAYFAVVAEGIRTDGGLREEDRNLQVRREFLDRAGNPVNIAATRQNDLVIVRVTLRSPVDLLENIAVSDLLPAGFEIENPRLNQMTAYAFTKDASVPEYLDVRDDRINFYTGFHGTKVQKAVFYYAMRAVTPGRYRYAPITAGAMYNGDYTSVNGGMSISVGR